MFARSRLSRRFPIIRFSQRNELRDRRTRAGAYLCMAMRLWTVEKQIRVDGLDGMEKKNVINALIVLEDFFFQ
jgi:hypothetical protein